MEKLTGFVCPSCGENAPANRIAKLAMHGGGIYVCSACEEKSFVIVDSQNRVIYEVICPVCGNLVSVNKLERDGVAIVPCLTCDKVKKPITLRRRRGYVNEEEKKEYRRIAVRTDNLGKITAIKEHKEERKKEWEFERTSFMFGMILMAIISVIFYRLVK